MKETLALVLLMLCISVSTQLYSQTVSTFVPGPSTFDDGLAMDAGGNIYASRYSGSTITKITPQGSTSIFSSGISTPNGSDFGPDGYLYVSSNVSNGKILKVSPSGVPEIFIQGIPYPTMVLFRSDRKMYISSYQTDAIYLADSTGAYSILYSGNGMNDPVGLAFDENENLIIADFTDGKIFFVDSSGVFTQITQIPAIVGFIAYSNGYIYSTGFNTHKIYKTSLSGQTTVLAGTGSVGQNNGNASTATFNSPNGIIASKGGDSLFISEYNTRSLRLITAITSGIINVSSVIPSEFNLGQNYPNPFNPVTKITFDVLPGNLYGKNKLVSLSVYDAAGKEIALLVNEELTPGKYEVDFNGEGFSSGIYFYTLTADDYRKTKSMMLLK